MDLKPVIEQSFIQYSGAVLQSRALVDARDCLKPSARQIFYALYTDKFTHDKIFKKTLKALGSAFRYYIHGDSSATGILMRAGQSFAMRYPLAEIEGNGGNLISSNNYAAPRYTGVRLSELSENLFSDIDKNTIDEWRDNYDDTEKFPGVLASKGFYNIVNGTFGIGIGMSSSIPQFNIVDVNNALIKLLQNPKVSFEDIYCPVDFATGGIVINESEVKTAIKFGKGGSCKIRSVIDYDEKEHCLIVSEIPYGVYTNTICDQLEEIVNGEDNPGIERFNDLTHTEPLIKIYLMKKARPEAIKNFLFKNTSLQSYFSINFTMLENGRFPRVFSWKEALQTHIDHEKIVYRKAFQYDLAKAEQRLHILEGLIKCLKAIDEVVELIKKSSTPGEAKKALMSTFTLDDAQASAVLALKLSKLAHLEIEQILDEHKKLTDYKNDILDILNTESRFNQVLIDGWNATIKKFGDEHRTQNINLSIDEPQEIEITPAEDCTVILNKAGILKRQPFTKKATQNRNTKGNKSNSGEIISIVNTDTLDNLAIFTNLGNMYLLPVDKIPEDKKGIGLNNLVQLQAAETVKLIASYKNLTGEIILATQQGMVKKMVMKSFNTKRKNFINLVKLSENDELITVKPVANDDILLITHLGMAIFFSSKDITTTFSKGINLQPNDYIVSSLVINNNDNDLCVLTEGGLGKRVRLSEFTRQKKGGKGIIVSKNPVVSAILVKEDNTLSIFTKQTNLNINVKDIPLQGRTTIGVKISKDNIIYAEIH